MVLYIDGLMSQGLMKAENQLKLKTVSCYSGVCKV